MHDQKNVGTNWFLNVGSKNTRIPLYYLLCKMDEKIHIVPFIYYFETYLVC